MERKRYELKLTLNSGSGVPIEEIVASEGEYSTPYSESNEDLLDIYEAGEVFYEMEVITNDGHGTSNLWVAGVDALDFIAEREMEYNNKGSLIYNIEDSIHSASSKAESIEEAKELVRATLEEPRYVDDIAEELRVRADKIEEILSIMEETETGYVDSYEVEQLLQSSGEDADYRHVLGAFEVA